MKQRNPEGLRQQEDRESGDQKDVETKFWIMPVISEAERHSKMRALELGVKPAVFEDELPFDAKRDGLILIDGLAINEGAVKRRVEQEPEFADLIKWDRSQSVSNNIVSALEGKERYSERYHLLMGFLLGFPRFAVENYVEGNRLERKVHGMDLGRLLDLGMFLDEGQDYFKERFSDPLKRQKVQAQIDLLDSSMQELVTKFYQVVHQGTEDSDFEDFIDRNREQFEEFYRIKFKLSPNEVERLLERHRAVVIKDPNGEGIMQFGVDESVPDLERKLRFFQEHIFEQYSKT